jgi:hypothetical protein
MSLSINHNPVPEFLQTFDRSALYSPPSVEEVLNQIRKKKPSKPPNCFIIFRNWLVKILKDKRYRKPMQFVSKLASELWKTLPTYVKHLYQNLAREIKHQFAHFPQNSMNLYQNLAREIKHQFEHLPQNSMNPSSSYVSNEYDTFHKYFLLPD